VFARDLLKLGPWSTLAGIKGAMRRGLLVEGVHYDRLNGKPVFYPERICPALFRATEVRTHGKAQETAERLRRVLAGESSGDAAP
jgi:hypothetical protein